MFQLAKPWGLSAFCQHSDSNAGCGLLLFGQRHTFWIPMSAGTLCCFPELVVWTFAWKPRACVANENMTYVQIYTTVGLHLEAENMYVWPTRPWKVRFSKSCFACKSIATHIFSKTWISFSILQTLMCFPQAKEKLGRNETLCTLLERM
jgi:hypothetical protein